MWRTAVRHLLLHIGVLLGACSGLCWAGAVRAWCEPGVSAARRAGGSDLTLALRGARLALPGAAAALALAAHLSTAAAATVVVTAATTHHARADNNQEKSKTITICRTLLLVLVVLVCVGVVVAALSGALVARAAARGHLPEAAAAADLLDVLRLLLRVCAKHHLLPDDIDLIIEETIEEFYVWIYVICAIVGLTAMLLLLAASAAITLLCADYGSGADCCVPTLAHNPSDTYKMQFEEKPLWVKSSSLRLEKARG